MLSTREITRVGSFVTTSMASVKATPFAVVTSTSDSFASVRRLASWAIALRAAPTAVMGWCRIPMRRSVATPSGTRVAAPFGATL